jgi:Na+-transporting NADH:ubiquinone oxidoreductase subunit NqrC
MSLSAIEGPQIAAADLEGLIAELRSAARKMSNEQILDIADLLHDMIRERQVEARSWRRIQARLSESQSTH